MKLFTCGPVEMYPSTANIRSKGFIYFRTQEFGDMVKVSLDKLAKLIGNNEKDSTIYLTNSGTGAMEAVVVNCVTENDKVLVVNGGGFGKRFCELLEYHNKNYDSVDIEWNETLTKEHFKGYENKNYTMLFINIHETSTGQLYDIEMISEFCKRNKLMLVVDAISSFLADDFNMGKSGVDATIISSQKGLCLSPGMSVVSFSKRMIEKVNNATNIPSKYFDFKDYLRNITRGQTPYTPTVMVMYELADMLNIIEEKGGKEEWLKEIKAKTQYFREKAKNLGLKMPSYPLSDMLTPILFEDINAYEVFIILKDKYQIYVTPCSGNLANKLLRVSHIGNTTIEDIDELLDKLTHSIREVKDKEFVYDRK